jgi:NAD(P)-dependent dehydrogenase (short-subunit alcohol dehydrogenase family)
MTVSTSKGCIIVTGASRGIGAAISLGLVRAGYTVGCLSRSGEAPQVEGATEADRSQWFSAKCDVSRPEQLKETFSDVVKLSGQPIVGLVNNAGIHSQGRVESIAEAEFKNVMDVNAYSVLAASQVVYPHLLENKGGLIVNIGSFFDKLGIKQHLTYCATKAAVAAMTRCMAVEWASKAIRVLNVAPGYIQTDFNREMIEKGPLGEFLSKRIPAGVPGNAQDVGQLVTSLFVLNSPYMTGETIYIDGGHGMLQ